MEIKITQFPGGFCLKFFKPILDPRSRSPILVPSFPVNLEVLLIKFVLFLDH